MKKTALVLGVSGQDGTYLTQLLLQKGYAVHGTSRDVESQGFGALRRLALYDSVSLHSVSPTDFRNLLDVVTRVQPDEIYNLSGQTSVGLSFAQPTAAFESIAIATIQVLEVLRHLKAPIRFYNACSSECFGEQPQAARCNEDTPFHPRSPYAMAKAAAFWAVANYREAYGVFGASGILFNHESSLRPERFVTRKIVSTAVRIQRGEPLRLRLGNLDVWRDWGYAPEYVEAMWMMLQAPKADDFVVATGKSHSLREFLDAVFRQLGLNWQEHVEIDPALLRATDMVYSGADASKAERVLGWKAHLSFAQLVAQLVNDEQRAAATGVR
jgi:GDPmannose 4,6-dehydratase